MMYEYTIIIHICGIISLRPATKGSGTRVTRACARVCLCGVVSGVDLVAGGAVSSVVAVLADLVHAWLGVAPSKTARFACENAHARTPRHSLIEPGRVTGRMFVHM